MACGKTLGHNWYCDDITPCEQCKRIADLEQLLACEKTALDDEKAEHALTGAENQRLREIVDEQREAVIKTDADNDDLRAENQRLLEAAQAACDVYFVERGEGMLEEMLQLEALLREGE